MKVLITGAEGQLGLSIQDVLKIRKIRFLTTSRRTMDVTNLAEVRKVIHKSGTNVIINAAAYTNVEKAEHDSKHAFDANEIGALNLAIAAREFNSRLIHFSTDYVFSGPRKTPWEINSGVNPISVYGKSKLAGEVAVRSEYPENSLILRTAWLYSPYGKNFYRTFLSLARKNFDTINVVNDQFGQPTNALELADLAITALIQNVPPGTYHASNSGCASWHEFALHIFKLAGADTRRIISVGTKGFPTVAPRPEYSVLDNSKWCEIGIKPLGPWEESATRAFPAIYESLSQ